MNHLNLTIHNYEPFELNYSYIFPFFFNNPLELFTYQLLGHNKGLYRMLLQNTFKKISVLNSTFLFMLNKLCFNTQNVARFCLLSDMFKQTSDPQDNNLMLEHGKGILKRVAQTAHGIVADQLFSEQTYI